MKVERVKNVQFALQKLINEQERLDKGGVVVGFSQSYAAIVHEDLDAKHAEGKQAKYLEAPARRLGKELGSIIARVYRQTKSISQGLMVAGLRLLREAQKIVPIDTGALKASGFVAFESEAEAKAASAFNKSESLRLTKALNKTKKSLKKSDTRRFNAASKRTRLRASKRRRRKK